LKLKYDEALSNFAFNFILRRYNEVAARGAHLHPEFHNDLALLYLAGGSLRTTTRPTLNR